MNKTNSKKLTPEQKQLKRLLSFRGIFIVYSPKEFFLTVPFIGALVALVCFLIIDKISILNHSEILKYLIEKYLNIFPNLLGFSLGGYAIIVGFGNTDFIKKIASSTDGKEFSIYEKLSSIFAFNLICQVVVLISTLICDFSINISTNYIRVTRLIVDNTNFTVNCMMVFLGIWTLLIIPYLVSNIFIFGQAYHTILKSQK